jgi:putative ABC transport system permease protein
MPDFKEEIRKRLAELSLSPTREGEIVEELSQHLEDQYEQSLSRGASEEEAREAVLLELNESNLLAPALKRVERRVQQNPVVMGTEGKTNMIGDLWQDLRYGLRMLMRNPGFTIVAVLALALGIGANSAIFSVVNTVLLRPLPYKNPDALMMVWEDATHLGFPDNTPSPANFIDWRDQNTVFESMIATAQASFNLTGVGDPERCDGRRVSANTFNLLGVEPILGRTFRPEEDKPGVRVVLLSYGLWQRRFGGDAGIVGRALNLNGESYTVIGVMPRSVELPGMDNWHDQLWVPIAFSSEQAASRGSHYLEVLARLKPGMTQKQAQAEMSTIAARLEKQYPEHNTRIGIKVKPLHDQVVGNIKPALLILLGAVGFVLLIACANVANLLLARAAVRQKEIALRLALGASRSRLTRQFVTESLLLAGLGGAAGLLLSIVGLNILKQFIPDSISQAQSIGIDGKVLIFTALVSLVTGLIFGLAPATQASNFNLNETLKEGGRDSSAGSRGNRLRGLLVISEVAVSFLLLIGAGLLISSFLHLLKLDPGYRADHLLTMKVALPETKYPDKERRAPFFRELIRRVQTLPGVQSVAVASNLPLTYSGDSMPIGIEGRADPPPDQWPDVVMRVASPGYFATMGIPLVQGRDFSEQDRPDAPRVAVMSEKTAKYYWPNESPIGKRFKPGPVTGDSPWREIVGVVKDVRQNDFAAEPKMQMYLCHEQVGSFAANAVVVRTSVDPLSLGPAVRKVVWEIDKDQPVSDIRSMEDIVSTAVARQRFSMMLLGIFAALALVLAAVGIYGVMSYSVAQRTREIGIRLALGAQRNDVLKMTMGQGLKLVLIGVAIGLVSAFILTRVMASLLFGVSATDPVTFVIISLILMSVALVASYIPALRATKVDPMVALHYQ